MAYSSSDFNLNDFQNAGNTLIKRTLSGSNTANGQPQTVYQITNSTGTYDVSPQMVQQLQSLGVQPVDTGATTDMSELQRLVPGGNFSTGGGSIINDMNGLVGQFIAPYRNTQAEQQQSSSAASLNQAIASKNTAQVEQLAPGYTLWHGAFVQKSQVPQLEASGATVDANGNVVSPNLPPTSPGGNTNGGTGGTQQYQVSRDQQGNFFINGQHITLDQFKALGLNASFVQPGQTVSLGQAQSGQAGAGNLTDTMKTLLQGMQAAGLQINPNVPITPEQAAEFMRFASQNANAFMQYAHQEIDPYYLNELKQATDDFQRSLGFNEQQLRQNEADIQKKYGDTLKQIGITSAERGFAQSGSRQLDEQNLAHDTQVQVNQGRSQLAYNENAAAAKFASTFGTHNLTGGLSRTLSGAPQFSAGESTIGQGSTPSYLYNLSPSVYNGLTGSEEFAQEAAVRNRASQLEGLYNSYNSLGRNLYS